jgi:PAT family beta-lactamase induction signal transducer AmpG
VENQSYYLRVAVIADDIAAAFATVAFVAFISLLVDRTYTLPLNTLFLHQ